MSFLCWFLLFSIATVHGTDGCVCTRDLDFINPAHWPVLRNLGSWLQNAEFLNIGYQLNNHVQAVVHTRSRKTYLYGSPSLYATGNSRVRELSELRGRYVKDIVFGFNFMVVLEYGGNVWAAGQNNYGQLSRDKTKRSTLTRVYLAGRVKEIAVTDFHCVVLTTDGQLFSWGRGNILGYNFHSSAHPSPRRFTLGTGVSRPNKICCGAYACAVLTDHSGVYSWGVDRQFGRAGNGRVPGRVMGIPSNENIVKLSCGLQHTVAVSSSGHLYGWGLNNHGELLQTRSRMPHATLLARRVTDAKAGMYLTVVRYESGTSGFFGRYNGLDYRTATPNTSNSPRDLMARSLLGSSLRGAVRLCG